LKFLLKTILQLEKIIHIKLNYMMGLVNL